MMKNSILKIGGSILSVKRDCSVGFFNFTLARKLAELIVKNLDKASIVIGGGYLNKWLLETSLKALPIEERDQHWIGIAALNVNAELFKITLKRVVGDSTRIYPEILRYRALLDGEFVKKVLSEYTYVVTGAARPDTSSDFDAYLLAKYSNADTIISLKNVAYVYSDDPSKNPKAVPINHLSWQKYLDLIKARKFPPRGNFPVDPVTARYARKDKIRFIIVDGTDLSNLRDLLKGDRFKGTIIE